MPTWKYAIKRLESPYTLEQLSKMVNDMSALNWRLSCTYGDNFIFEQRIDSPLQAALLEMNVLQASREEIKKSTTDDSKGGP